MSNVTLQLTKTLVKWTLKMAWQIVIIGAQFIVTYRCGEIELSIRNTSKV